MISEEQKQNLATLLPEEDVEYLLTKDWDFDYYPQNNGEIDIVFHNYPLPDGKYSTAKTDLLIRLQSGYPDTNPDMYWTSDRITLSDGRTPDRADQQETYLNRSWQRWSRHYPEWRQGVDNLRTKMTSIKSDLDHAR